MVGAELEEVEEEGGVVFVALGEADEVCLVQLLLLLTISLDIAKHRHLLLLHQQLLTLWKRPHHFRH